MIIKSIKLEGFRNIEKLSLDFDANRNLIFGENASGKTSVIESIYFCAFGRSFRGKDSDLIQYERDFCRVEADFIKNNAHQKIEYAISRTKGKWFKINSKNARNLSDVLSNIHVVIFTPDDLRIIKDGPGIRRSFLNKEMSGISRLYYKNLMDLNHILKQRNALLKTGGNPFEFDVWNEKLAEISYEIIKERLKFVEMLSKISREIHFQISDRKEHLNLEYKSSLVEMQRKMGLKQFEKKYIKDIIMNFFEKDRKLGYTSIGPHTDDFEILINSKVSKVFASQGQQRTAALSVKLAEVELIHQKTGHYPIVLLDDILSELDDRRKTQLQSIFDRSQTILTNVEDVGIGHKIDFNRTQMRHRT